MNLSRLFLLNALFTALGGLILIFVPNHLMQFIGISLPQDSFFLYYLLAVTSLSLALLSFKAMKLKDKKSLKVIAVTFFLFHFSTSIVGLNAFLNGTRPQIWLNIGIHIIFAVLFWYFGILNTKKANV